MAFLWVLLDHEDKYMDSEKERVNSYLLRNSYELYLMYSVWSNFKFEPDVHSN